MIGKCPVCNRDNLSLSSRIMSSDGINIMCCRWCQDSSDAKKGIGGRIKRDADKLIHLELKIFKYANYIFVDKINIDGEVRLLPASSLLTRFPDHTVDVETLEPHKYSSIDGYDYETTFTIYNVKDHPNSDRVLLSIGVRPGHYATSLQMSEIELRKYIQNTPLGSVSTHLMKYMECIDK